MSLLKRIENARAPSEVGRPGAAPADGGRPGSPGAPGGPGSGRSEGTRVPARPGAPAPTAAGTPASLLPRRESFRDIKLRVQNKVMQALGSGLDLSDPAAVRKHVEEIINGIFDDEGLALTRAERSRLLEQVIDEVVGLGPIEPLIQDETITEVMVNGPRQVYIERAGRLERTDVVFANDDHVMKIIDRIINPIGRRIDETSPRVDARLADGSRVNAIIPPLSLVGPVVTIRKFSKRPFTVDDLIRFGTASPEMFDFLKACVLGKLNLFVSGGTGSGKTTTLNVLSSFIPNDERIITIEDAAELQLRQQHVITLEARPPNVEGRGEITIRDLLRNALHMRPDRIIVGECRSGEALDMLQAMNTGQDGSLSTGHANTPADMLRRLETMVLMTGYELPLRAIREQMAAAVDLIVHTARLKDGSRKVVTITEVLGMDGDEIVTQDVFEFEQTGVEEGRILGSMRPTGKRPKFVEKLRANGVELPPGTFGPEPTAEDLAAEAAAEAAKPLVGYSPAVAAGGMVFVSGIGPVDPESRLIVGATIQEQTRQCVRNLQARLREAGSDLDRLVWVTWALRDSADLEGFMEEWERWFEEATPAREGAGVPILKRSSQFRISINAIAEGIPVENAPARGAESSWPAELFRRAASTPPGPR